MGVTNRCTFRPSGGVGSAAGSSVGWGGFAARWGFAPLTPANLLVVEQLWGCLHTDFPAADLHVWWTPVSIQLLCCPHWSALWICTHPGVAVGVFFHRGDDGGSPSTFPGGRAWWNERPRQHRVGPGWWSLIRTAAVYRGRPSCSKRCLKRGVVLRPPKWIPL